MSNRIAVFDDGVIQQLATPADLYERPDNAFVAPFIGENNKLCRQGRGAERQELLGAADGRVAVQALPVNVAGTGEQTTLSLRPERVRIAPARAALANSLRRARRGTDLSRRPHPHPRQRVRQSTISSSRFPMPTHRRALAQGETGARRLGGGRLPRARRLRRRRRGDRNGRPQERPGMSTKPMQAPVGREPEETAIMRASQRLKVSARARRVSLLALAAYAQDPIRLTVVSWGGAYTESQHARLSRPLHGREPEHHDHQR